MDRARRMYTRHAVLKAVIGKRQIGKLKTN
jgi:hypothetical protein